MAKKLLSTRVSGRRMTDGEMDDLYDILKEGAKRVPTVKEWLNKTCRQLERPKKPVNERTER